MHALDLEVVKKEPQFQSFSCQFFTEIAREQSVHPSFGIAK